MNITSNGYRQGRSGRQYEEEEVFGGGVVRWERRSEVEENERDFTLHTKFKSGRRIGNCGKKVMA